MHQRPAPGNALSQYHITVKRHSILACIVALTLAARANELPDLGDRSQAEFTPALERKIGESLWRDMRSRERSYLDDAEVIGYLNQLGARLAANNPEAKVDFELFALRDPTMNAFAWPGGFIGVNSGLIVASETESELASVLCHEMAHVTQHHIARLFDKRGQSSTLAVASLILAVLGARSNSQASQAALVAGQAAGVAAQLAYTRDFEREADRIGFQTLEASGFDPRGMAAFFERLERATRFRESGAPSYARTHPLTADRISDMAARVQLRPYRQVVDSTDFLFVRAKLKAMDGNARDRVVDLDSQLAQATGVPAQAVRYGLVRALMRANDLPRAEKEFAVLRRARVMSPMVDGLAGELRTAARDYNGAVAAYREGLQRAPHARALMYGLVESLLSVGQPQEALAIVNGEVNVFAQDPKLFQLQAKASAALGKRLSQHRAQAEYYALNGQLRAAIEQLDLATKAGDGDFYEQSAAEARLREFQQRFREEQESRF